MSRLRRSLVPLLAVAFAAAAPPASRAEEQPPGVTAQDAPSLVVVGAGFGHGVGMSQYGAYAKAQAGSAASDIIAYYYQGAAPVAVSGLGLIGVSLVQGSPQVTLQVLGRPGGGPQAEIHSGSAGGPLVATCPVGTTCVVNAAGGQAQLTGASALAAGTRDQPLFVSVEPAGGPVLINVPEWGAYASHGSIEILPTAANPGQLNAVDIMDLDYAYVAGISEVPSSWPVAALDAQAIAARTYAWQRHRGGACDCDVTSDTFDQVYGGWQKEQQQAWADAARRTQGQVIEFGGQKISAFYSSSSGGRTEANEDAFGGSPVPYLRSVDDPWSLTPANPLRSWQRAFTASQAAADLGFDRVLGVSVTGRTQGGSIATAIVSGVRGGVGATRAVTGSQLRFALSLPSTHADVPVANFDEYLLLYNPGGAPSTVTVSLLLADSPPVAISTTVGPGARQTLRVNDFAPFQSVSASIHATSPVVAERAMYFNYLGKWDGGHASGGVTGPSLRWLLAEGFISPSFDTYVLVANANSTATTAHLRLFGSDGRTAGVDLPLGPNSRGTVRLNDVTSFGAGDVSVEVTALQPVVVERSEYFDYGPAGWTGGHATHGATAPSPDWFLAEGFTAPNFDTYVLIENPLATDVSADVTLMKPDGTTQDVVVPVPGQSRQTLNVKSVPGFDSTEVSFRVHASGPVVAERSMYFDYGGRTGGHDALGVSGLGTQWFLAEGFTAPNFDTYVLVANPDMSRTATVALEYHQNSGLAGTRTLSVPPQSRRTVKVNDDVSGDVSTVVTSINGVPVAAERSMYFDYRGRNGGSDAEAVPAPSAEWFFAEGYTGA